MLGDLIAVRARRRDREVDTVRRHGDERSPTRPWLAALALLGGGHPLCPGELIVFFLSGEEADHDPPSQV